MRGGVMPVHGRTCRTSEVGEDGVSDDIALDYVPAYGVAEPIAKSLRRLTARNGGPLTYRGTNCYLLGEREIMSLIPVPTTRSTSRTFWQPRARRFGGSS